MSRFEGAKIWFRWLRQRRLLSELYALEMAMRAPRLAIFPIGVTCGFWFFVACLPTLPFQFLLIAAGSLALPVWLYGALSLLIGAMCFCLLMLIIPWFFGWYWTAATLQFGNQLYANDKAEWLRREIGKYRPE
ncbi:MAG: hypothetical protein U1A24_00195 [Cypionkella sp.]|uniref:hypothetical protein n=1 Tax=Cypionkella sp. TaxID=2811411 RepID=UPI002ABAFA76|nr:hypothetical protein [Cypionkella sp.]MDZ4308965.1 hypothetical protein [Cypionkella sp.]